MEALEPFLPIAKLYHKIEIYKLSYDFLKKFDLKTRIKSRLPRFFERIAKTDLLILDDFGMKRLNTEQVLDQMEIIEDRHGRQTTIIANQVPSQYGMRPFRATTHQLT